MQQFKKKTALFMLTWQKIAVVSILQDYQLSHLYVSLYMAKYYLIKALLKHNTILSLHK